METYASTIPLRRRGRCSPGSYIHIYIYMYPNTTPTGLGLGVSQKSPSRINGRQRVKRECSAYTYNRNVQIPASVVTTCWVKLPFWRGWLSIFALPPHDVGGFPPPQFSAELQLIVSPKQRLVLLVEATL